MHPWTYEDYGRVCFLWLKPICFWRRWSWRIYLSSEFFFLPIFLSFLHCLVRFLQFIHLSFLTLPFNVRTPPLPRNPCSIFFSCCHRLSSISADFHLLTCNVMVRAFHLLTASSVVYFAAVLSRKVQHCTLGLLVSIANNRRQSHRTQSAADEASQKTR